MKKRFFILLGGLGVLCVAPAVSWSSEFKETMLFANAAFLQGRFEDAVRSYRYAVALDPNSIEAQLDLAITLRDLGRDDEAQPLLLKASLLAPDDPAVFEARAWNELQRERYDDAHDAFKRAVRVASGTAPSWGVYFGDGLAYLRDREKAEAGVRFKSAMLTNPLDPAPMVLLAGVLREQGEKDPALTWYRRALALDPMMREAEEGLALVLKERGEPEASWQLVTDLLASDANDPALLRLRNSLSSSVRKRGEDLIPVRRLSWPLLEKAQPAPPGPEFRVALFADARGYAAEVTSFTFICNSPFRIKDEKLGDVSAGKRMEGWRVSFESAGALVSLKALGTGESYATRNSVELVPEPGADLVLKNVAAPDSPGRDPGDREIRGRLTISPAASGLSLTATVALEDYIRSALASAQPDGRYPEALKALALVLRTRARARAAGATLHPGAAFTHCDSAHCGTFTGVSDENTRAAAAVEATRGWDLTLRGAPIEALDHQACGGRTQSAEGIGRDAPYLTEAVDGPQPPADSPWGLERFTQRETSKELLDLVAHPEGSTAVRWTRVLDGARLEERLQRMGLKGRLKDLLPGARTSGGRLQTLFAVGSRGTLELKGEADIAKALSPGSLRSTLVTLRVLKSRGMPVLVILYGAGTGHGMGLCRHGADGLAAGGKSMAEILEHYFPKAEIVSPTPASLRLSTPPNRRGKK